MGIGDYPAHWERDLPQGVKLARRELRIENCHVPNMVSRCRRTTGWPFATCALVTRYCATIAALMAASGESIGPTCSIAKNRRFSLPSIGEDQP